MLGVGGTWVGSLTLMQPFRPVFIVLTLAFLGLAFRRLYVKPPVCVPDTPCADPRVIRRQKMAFWLVCVLLSGLLAVPQLAAWFYY
jgi:mercuric ion transport protein